MYIYIICVCIICIYLKKSYSSKIFLYFRGNYFSPLGKNE